MRALTLAVLVAAAPFTIPAATAADCTTSQTPLEAATLRVTATTSSCWYEYNGPNASSRAWSNETFVEVHESATGSRVQARYLEQWQNSTWATGAYEARFHYVTLQYRNDDLGVNGIELYLSDWRQFTPGGCEEYPEAYLIIDTEESRHDVRAMHYLGDDQLVPCTPEDLQRALP